jgi:hypothetical protein
MTEGGTPGGAAGGPAVRKEGWYRDRATGQRRFWNGQAWTDFPSLVTPFTYGPEPEVESPPPPPPTPKRPIDKRTKVIGGVVAIIVVILAIVGGLALSSTETEPVATTDTVQPPAFPSGTAAPANTTTSTLEPTTTSTSTAVTGTSVASIPTVTGPATKPATSPEVPNPSGNVAIIGDSITVLSAFAITHDFHQYHVVMDAVIGTRMADQLGAIERLASDGQPWDWIIELGTNDALPEPSTNPNWAADFDNEVAAVQSQRCVVFVTVNPRFVPIGPEIDSAIAGAVATHPNFHSLDWGDTELKKPGWLDSDGIHPSKSGAIELAKLEHKAIRSCQAQ